MEIILFLLLLNLPPTDSIIYEVKETGVYIQAAEALTTEYPINIINLFGKNYLEAGVLFGGADDDDGGFYPDKFYSLSPESRILTPIFNKSYRLCPQVSELLRLNLISNDLGFPSFDTPYLFKNGACFWKNAFFREKVQEYVPFTDVYKIVYSPNSSISLDGFNFATKQINLFKVVNYVSYSDVDLDVTGPTNNDFLVSLGNYSKTIVYPNIIKASSQNKVNFYCYPPRGKKFTKIFNSLHFTLFIKKYSIYPLSEMNNTNSKNLVNTQVFCKNIIPYFIESDNELFKTYPSLISFQFSPKRVPPALPGVSYVEFSNGVFFRKNLILGEVAYSVLSNQELLEQYKSFRHPALITICLLIIIYLYFLVINVL